jgi:predicted enzyme related to lactoylglutathione lyase
MAGKVVHFEASAKDGNALREWYAKTFGWQFNVMPEMDYATVDNGGAGINGGIGGQGPAPKSAAIFYVAVPDLQKTLDEVEKQGGKTTMPVMEIPNIVTLAQFTDPDGNLVGLVKDDPNQTPPPSTAKPAENPVTWFEITGKDYDKTREFYSKVFGWDYNLMDGYAMVNVGEGELGGGIGPANGQSHAIWYVEVADPAKKLEEIEKSGGKVVMPANDMGMVVTGLFDDPAGNRVGVYRMNQQQ